ncbi:MAG: hypothetical protein J5813_02580 [Candidatus Methanomethylophilaceae archaeon]|nr:hypothetical protein [Candidatus Methanomethylophilaceae archaeon]
MNADEDKKERRSAIIKLMVLPIPIIIVLITVLMGIAPGLEAGHPLEYLTATCILWAVFILVLPLLRLLRIFSLPLWFEIILYANIYLYVCGLCYGLYLNVSWWGDMTHVLSSLIVAGFVFLVICLMTTRLPPHTDFGGRKGLTLLLFLVAMSFGGIWEIMEGATDFISGYSYMIYGATDTLGDITADFIGVSLMTMFAYVALGKHDAKEIAKEVRFGKESFRIDG